MSDYNIDVYKRQEYVYTYILRCYWNSKNKIQKLQFNSLYKICGREQNKFSLLFFNKRLWLFAVNQYSCGNVNIA